MNRWQFGGVIMIGLFAIFVFGVRRIGGQTARTTEATIGDGLLQTVKKQSDELEAIKRRIETLESHGYIWAAGWEKYVPRNKWDEKVKRLGHTAIVVYVAS